MKNTAISLFILFSVNSAYAAAENKTCAALGDNLYNCSAFECDTPSPVAKDKFIHNKIIGLKNGVCVHEQLNPDGSKITCRYSEESRKFLGIKMKKAQSDLTNMPELSVEEENIYADIFQNECQIDGKNAAHMAHDENIENPLEENDDGDVDVEPETQIVPPEDTISDKIKDNGDLLDAKD